MPQREDSERAGNVGKTARRQIAILGGGCGSMAAAFWLTNDPGWSNQYSVTVYQVGWRLGGKGASGRGVQGRIEEHGLHLWAGFYHNAFELIRGCYGQLGWDWQDVFKGVGQFCAEEFVDHKWSPWPAQFPDKPGLPGDPMDADGSSIAEVAPDRAIRSSLKWLRQRISLFDFGPNASDDKKRVLRLTRRLEVNVSRWVAAVTRVDKTFETALASDAEAARSHVRSLFSRARESDDLRHMRIAADVVMTCTLGMIVDGVMQHGYDVIDEFELREWLRDRHHARQETVDSALVMAGYDYVFAYPNGDVERPALSAGVALRGITRLLFGYRGSLFWKMRRGMGDAVFIPLYELLKRRGVRFEFFHRVLALHVSDDGRAIQSITMARQVDLKNKEYDPSISCRYTSCWPARPRFEQIVDGDELAATWDKNNLEMPSSQWPSTQFTLERPRDFDFVVLGISLAELRSVCCDLSRSDDAWKSMFDKLATTATLSTQLWFNATPEELEWSPPRHTVITNYEQPLNTIADMSHVLPDEDTPAIGARCVLYLCGLLRDGVVPEDSTQKDADAIVQEQARQWLSCFVRTIVRRYDAANIIDFPGMPGTDSLSKQYYRANITPTERYVLSVPGTSRYRISPSDPRFRNLFLAGDWTANGLNAGCVEAAVTSGVLAANAILGVRRYVVGTSDRDGTSTRNRALARFVAPELAGRVVSRPSGGAPTDALELRCVVLVADICDFMSLGDRLSERYGHESGYRVLALLNECFSPMTGAVSKYGGEVVAIRGDSLLALWYVDETPLAHAIMASNACARRLHELSSQVAVGDEELQLHVGISLGRVVVLPLLTARDRLRLVCGGDGVFEAEAALKEAPGGQTVVSPSWWAGRPPGVDGFGLREGRFSLSRVSEEALFEPCRSPCRPLSREAIEYLVPEAVIGLDLNDPLAFNPQTRLITCGFCRVHGVRVEGSLGDRGIQSIVSHIQTIVYERFGCVDRVDLDDAGLLLVLLFGLPNRRGLGTPVHAVEAGLQIDTWLSSLGFRSSIGIASYSACCGVVGGDEFAHYTCHGRSPNVAARLMSFIERGVACDDETATLSEEHFRFERQPPAPLKGLPSDSGLNRLTGRSNVAPGNDYVRFTGREKELAHVVSRLALNVRNGTTTTVTIEADAGSGKTAFVAEVKRRIEALDVLVLEIRGARNGVSATFASNVEDFGALGAAAGARGDLAGACTSVVKKRSLIVLDDEAWIDRDSRELAWKLVAAMPSGLLLLTRRPDDPPIGGVPRSEQIIRLPRLTRGESDALVRSCAGIKNAPEELFAWAFEQARGIPRLTVAALKDLYRKRADLSRTLGSVAPEGMVESDLFIVEQIDAMAAASRQALLIVSVIEAPFDLATLLGVSPWPLKRREARFAIADLERLGVVASGPPHKYQPTWPRFLLVASSLLNEKDRRIIHSRIADHLLADPAHDVASLRRLATHLNEAGRTREATVVLDSAAATAVKTGAHAPARDALELLLRMTEGSETATSSRAHWLAMLAQTYAALGRLADAEFTAREGLSLLRIPLPKESRSWITLLAGQVLRHAAIRASTAIGFNGKRKSDHTEASITAVRAFGVSTYFSAKPLPLFASNLLAMNLAESAGNAAASAPAAAVVGYMLGLMRFRGSAARVFGRARTACIQASDIAGHHATLGGQAMCEIGFGEFRDARRTSAEALRLCRLVGDPYEIELALTLAALNEHYAGYFKESLELFREIYSSANARNNRQHIAWGAYGMAQNLLILGFTKEAVYKLQEATEAMLAVDDRHSDLICSGLLSLAHLHLGDYTRASHFARLALEQARHTSPNNFGSFVGYYSAPTTLISLWGRASRFGHGDAAEFEAGAKVSLGYLRRFAGIFPVATPRLHLLKGWVALRGGSRASAQVHWRRSLRLAKRLELRYDQALAHWSLAQLSRGSAAARSHADESNRLFFECESRPILVEIGSD